MSDPLVVNGVTFEYPELGDEGWAEAASGWAAAVTQGMLQKAGGSFVLTAEVDFGGSFGLKSLYYKSRATNPSSAGQIRLGNTDTIAFRNAANDGNVTFTVNASNQFVLSGDILPSAANTYDLGKTGSEFKDLKISGDADIGGDLNVTGAVTVGSISIANLTISGNTIIGDNSSDTLTVNATSTFAAAAGFTSITASGVATLNGNVVLGSDSSDTVAFNGLLSTDIIPSASTKDLGSNAVPFAEGHIQMVAIGDGTVSAPSLNFDNDVNTGFYHIGTDNFGATANGAKVLDISTAGLGVTGTLIVSGQTTLATSLTGIAHLVSGVVSASAIVNADVSASAAIAFSKLAALTSANILVGSAGNVATAVAVTGDIAIDNAGVTSIAAGVIVNADINASAAIAFSKLASLTSAHILVGSAGNVATDVAVSGDITLSNAGVVAIATGVIVNADISASAAIDFSKLASLTSAHILVGSAGNVATDVAVTGDVTISNAGVTAIGSGVIVNADVNASAAIAGTKISPDFGSQNVATTGLVTIGNGDTTQPGISFASDTDLGMYRISSNIIGFAAGGSNKVTIDGASNYFRIASGLAYTGAASNASSPLFVFTGDETTGIYSSGAGAISFSNAGTAAGEIDSSGNLNLFTQHALRLQDTTGGQYVGLRASGTQTTYTITLPAAAPAGAGNALTYDGANYVWATPAGAGNVSGPGGGSTDNAVVRWDSTSGTTIQNSAVIIDDSNNVTGVVGLTATGIISGASLVPSSSTVATNGLYLPSANTVGLATNSTLAMTVDSTQRFGVSGAVNTSSVMNIGATNPLTGSTQVAHRIALAGTSAATAQVIGVLTSSFGTAAASFTCDLVTPFMAGSLTKGAASTITRSVNFYSVSQVGTPTNTAHFADNVAFTGDYFIHQSGTVASVFNGTVGFGGTTNANAIVNVGVSNPLSGTTQRGYRAVLESTSAATARTAGFSSAATSVATAFTTAVRVHFESTDQPNGAGSTITRDISFKTSGTFYGTNNAAIANNEAFTGDWFINSTNTNPSLFSGSVQVPNGSVSVPSVAFSSDADGTGTGIYRVGANSLGFAANGVRIGSYSSAGAWILGESGGVQDQTINGISTTLQGTNSGAGINISVLNASNTSSSTSFVQARVGGTSAGNAFFQANALGGQSWAWGLAQSDASNKFKICNATGITGSSEMFSISTAGIVAIGASGGTQTHVLATNTATTVGAAGGASALPGTPTGYIVININGTDRKIPYYAT